MEAAELRAGNLIYMNGVIIQLTGVTQYGIYWGNHGYCALFLQSTYPIEFTDEWIERLNIANGEGIHNDKFSGYLTIQKDERGRFSLYVGSVELVYFEYVHELQNIWYALTGEELTNN